MSLDTYAELQNQVKSFLHRAALLDALGADNVPTLIELGEKWIFRKARAREMETSLNVAITSGAAAVPSDFAAIKHARIDGSPSIPLTPMASHAIYARYPLRSSGGIPKYIGVDGSSFIFGPYPSSDGTLLGTYYAKLTSIDTSANALFLAHPDLYLYASLAEASAYVKSPEWIPFWEGKRASTLADVNGEAKESEQGSAMEVVPG